MRVAICLFLFGIVVTSCTISRRPAGKVTEHSPVSSSNLAIGPKDEPPIIKTEDGYEPSTIPGVPPQPAKQHEYTTFIGPSN